MDEKTALTKWCPYAAQVKEIRLQSMTQLLATNPTSISIANDIAELQADYTQKCIASDCMMWIVDLTAEAARSRNACSSVKWEASGHCGLTK